MVGRHALAPAPSIRPEAGRCHEAAERSSRCRSMQRERPWPFTPRWRQEGGGRSQCPRGCQLQSRARSLWPARSWSVGLLRRTVDYASWLSSTSKNTASMAGSQNTIPPPTSATAICVGRKPHRKLYQLICRVAANRSSRHVLRIMAVSDLAGPGRRVRPAAAPAARGRRPDGRPRRRWPASPSHPSVVQGHSPRPRDWCIARA